MRSIRQTEYPARDRDVRETSRRFQDLLLSLGRYRSLRNPIGDVHEEMDLTPQQFHTILQLGNEGSLQMGALAQLCGITEKTITGVVDRLEREKLVQRIRDSTDRRVIRVRLSPKGEFAFKKVRTIMLLKLERMMSFLDPPDRQHLLRIMEKLLERMKALSGAENLSKKAVL